MQMYSDHSGLTIIWKCGISLAFFNDVIKIVLFVLGKMDELIHGLILFDIHFSVIFKALLGAN